MPSYEYPFNERIRTLLRVEDLFIKIQRNCASGQEFAHHNALIALFQILDVMDRADLKTELLMELDRQKVAMNGLRENPSISKAVLEEIVRQIEATALLLRNDVSRLGQSLRDNEWLMSIKSRTSLPGGVCEFDLPSYHFWLGQDAENRRADFDNWLQPLVPAYDAIRIVLHLLRGSGRTSKQVAVKGAFQEILNGGKPAQLMRIELADNQPCFPEVSANKYVINIRFNRLEKLQKTHLCEEDIEFALTLCNL